MNGDSMDRLKALSGMLGALTGGEKRMEPVGTLSPKDLKEWEEIKKIGARLNAQVGEHKSRRDFFWARLRVNCSELQDRETLTIEEGGIVMASVEEKTPVEFPMAGLPQIPELPEDVE